MQLQQKLLKKMRSVTPAFFFAFFPALFTHVFARIGLVEWHHHVLVHIMNATKHNELPAAGVKDAILVHFDSHADMALPKPFDSQKVWDDFTTDPAKIIDYTDINNWVTTTWYLGVVKKMLFVEPPWGGEFIPMHYHSLRYTIGEVDGEFKIRIRTPEGVQNSEYFHTVDDGKRDDPMDHFADVDKMINTREIEVEIVRFDELFHGDKLANFIHSNKDSPFILDIDLDVFSTESPSHLWWLRHANIPVREQEMLGGMWSERGVRYQDDWYDTFKPFEKSCPSLLDGVVLAERLQDDKLHNHIQVPNADSYSLGPLIKNGPIEQLWNSIDFNKYANKKTIQGCYRKIPSEILKHHRSPSRRTFI